VREGVLTTISPYLAFLNIRFGALKDFDAQFFKDEERCIEFGFKTSDD
jgi:hypothetical protein